MACPRCGGRALKRQLSRPCTTRWSGKVYTSTTGGTMRRHRSLTILLGVLAATAVAPIHAGDDGWLTLFNGKDTAGWKLRADKITIMKFLDADNNEVPGAKVAMVDQKMELRDAKGMVIPGAK